MNLVFSLLDSIMTALCPTAPLGLRPSNEPADVESRLRRLHVVPPPRAKSFPELRAPPRGLDPWCQGEDIDAPILEAWRMK